MNFAIFTYNNIDNNYASGNIGDYIQSLAQINVFKKIIEKKENIKLDFEYFLNKVLDNSIERCNFAFIDRDNMHLFKSELSNIILIMNGWWMWPSIDYKLHFEIPSNIKPIFVSFHINNYNLLNETYLKIFKKYEPIGCRDLNTVKILKEKNINCYFSGCLTLTLDILKYIQGNINYQVDCGINIKDNMVKINHVQYKYRNKGKENLLEAYNLLKKYSRCKHVYTSKLHCYLPCLSLKIPVSFINSNMNDRRFGGLLNLTNEKIEEIRNNLLKIILETINE